ncbi:MAG: hypothetical protein A2Z34_00685 [Planctomycetes bacterium RBG_16_59_8]|nr:MAG: hypothetical protein A2Z34_00685 [Planctomycetes bacterium RBG_16_59_8]
MKLDCLKKIPLGNGVDGYAICQKEYPVATIFDLAVANMGSNASGRAIRRRRGGATLDDAVLPTMTFRGEGEPIAFRGFLVYDSPYHLISCLVDRYQPSSERMGHLDFVLQMSGDLSSPSKRREVEHEIFRHLLARHARAFDPKEAETTFPLFPAIVSSELDSFAGELVALDHEIHAFKPPLDWDGFLTLSLERDIDIHGYVVPTRRFLVYQQRESVAFFREGGSISKISMKRRSWEAVSHSLPPDFVEGVETDGIVSVEQFDFLPRRDLVARTLIRVPSLREVEGKRDETYCKSLSQPSSAEKPLYLADTRQAGAPIEGCVLIDTPDEVLYILSRTCDGLYVPGDVGRAPETPFGEKASFLAGMEVI